MKCEVCNGTGKVFKSAHGYSYTETCRHCDGFGIKKVRETDISRSLPIEFQKGKISDFDEYYPPEQLNTALLESQGILYCQDCGESLKASNKIYTINHYECLKKRENKLIAEFKQFLGYYMLEWKPQLSEAMAKELHEEYKKWEEKLQ